MAETLLNAVPVTSEMAFDLDIGPAPRTSYLLSVPGHTTVVSLGGLGTWTVEVLGSTDGLTFGVVGTHTLPGDYRYNSNNVVAVAIRVASYTSGTPLAQLSRGGITTRTNVSPLFGTTLPYAFRTGTAETIARGEVKFNATLIGSVTKVWIAHETEDTIDQFYAVQRIPPGGTLLMQERSNHLAAVLFRVTGAVVNKTGYVEVPVAYLEHVGTLSPQGRLQVILAAFNPGASLSFAPPAFVDRLPDIKALLTAGDSVPEEALA